MRLTGAGVELVGPVREEPYGTLQVFRDPFGNLWDLLADRTYGVGEA